MTSSAPIAANSQRVYVDASAFVKLILDEPESAAFTAFMTGLAAPAISSEVLRVEAVRAVRLGTRSSDATRDIETALDELTLASLDDSTLRRAARLDPSTLRSLDAIHLTTALNVGADVMVVYDRALAAAATANGIVPVAPS